MHRSRHDQSVLGRRAAHTLLELVCAATILAITLVPALRMMRDAIENGERTEKLAALNQLCVSKLEEQLCLAASAWNAATAAGSFSAEGYSTIRYSVLASQDPADGGIANQLMAVTVTVWDDGDGDGALDAGEPRVSLASKVARLAKYQTKASGS